MNEAQTKFHFEYKSTMCIISDSDTNRMQRASNLILKKFGKMCNYRFKILTKKMPSFGQVYNSQENDSCVSDGV